MAEVEKVIDKLYRLRSHLRVMCVGIHDDYYKNSVQTVDDAIQTIRELSDGERIVDGVVDYCDMNQQCRYVEELQEKLELPENYQKGFQDGWVRALEQIPKWYLCSEELPSDNYPKLVIVNGKVNNLGFLNAYEFGEYHSGKWIIEHYENEKGLDVIAWMELPKFEEVE